MFELNPKTKWELLISSALILYSSLVADSVGLFSISTFWTAVFSLMFRRTWDAARVMCIHTTYSVHSYICIDSHLYQLCACAMFYNYYVCPFNHAFSQTNPNRLRFYFLRSVAPNHKFIKKLFLRQVLKYTQYANYLHCSAMRSNLLCK